MTVFGLGNPTERYAETRHNIGFMVADQLARRLKVKFKHLPGRYLVRAAYARNPLVLVKPLLYMNESGVPIKEHLTQEPDDFLVVCDDLALPFGKLRLRPQGSDGGHNGLASVIYHLEATEFPRLRIGIGSPPPDKEGAEYVLESFTPSEADCLPDLLARASDACLAVLVDGLEAAMNRFNPEKEDQDSALTEEPT